MPGELKRIELNLPEWTVPEPGYEFPGESPGGETLSMNRRRLLRGGRPWFPVMGEFHFSRYPEQYWEEELLKMKSGGIDIVSVYVFWIHHEEVEGEFDWSGQRDLGGFVRLCGRLGMYVWLRPGPWCHGECRNGGFPDWIQNGGFETRCDGRPYLDYVERFFREIRLQIPGMMFCEGGPVIGIQLENEYGHAGGQGGEAGIAHIRTLKALCLRLGLAVPFYTTTAWGGAVVAEGETIPVFGGYVEAPWDQHVHEQPASREYLFLRPASETTIGTDLQTGQTQDFSFDPGQYPYLTAELGGGLQVTRHRRPYVTGDDIEAAVVAKLASGVAAIGYYMYHGGTNPMGKLSTLQESRATGMSNDLPELSYDFQAPLREYGQMHDSYGKLRRLHLFLRDFGEELANTVTLLPDGLPDDAEDTKALRYSVRYGPRASFLFLSNYQRRRAMADKTVRARIQTPEGALAFPDIALPDGARWILPLRMRLGGVTLEWSTAQLLCSLHGEAVDTYVLFGDKTTGAALSFAKHGIAGFNLEQAVLDETESSYVISVPVPGKNVSVTLATTAGDTVRLLVLNLEESEQAVKVKREGGEYLALSDAGQYDSGEGLRLLSRRPEASLFVYPASWRPLGGSGLTPCGAVGLFAAYRVRFLPAGTEPAAGEREVNARVVHTRGGSLCAEFDLDRQLDGPASDWFLKAGFAGDGARLFINGRKVADWFYLGGEWDVGLKRFVQGGTHLHFRLEVDPLKEDDFVYLDKRPVFEDGVCCRLNRLAIEPEYSVVF